MSYEIDMCHGPLFRKIVLFALPLVGTYILHLLFNAVDLVVIGQCSTHESLAAIGSTLTLNSLIINLMIGLTIGTNVIAAKFYGAGDHENLSKAVHTSMILAVTGGILTMVFGIAFAKTILVWMATPPEILGKACTYIWICFAVIPFIMVNNFGCAILRAVGDTRRPFLFLSIAGIVNVGLNMIFVICFGMDVAGVAIATAISHFVAASLIMVTLLRTHGCYRFEWKKCRLDRECAKEILRLGVPAGLQGSCFALSNMMIQSSVNSFGSYAMAGNVAAGSLEGIVYVASNAFHQVALSFVAQNLGGNRYKRIVRSMLISIFCAFTVNLIMGWGFYLAGHQLLSIYDTDEEVIRWGILRMKVMFTTYFFCGMMDVVSGGLRGLGYSLTSTIITLFFACIFRIIWIVWIFPLDRTYEFLLVSYPISWFLCVLVSSIVLICVFRKLVKEHCRRAVPWMHNRPGVMRGLRIIGGSK